MLFTKRMGLPPAWPKTCRYGSNVSAISNVSAKSFRMDFGVRLPAADPEPVEVGRLFFARLTKLPGDAAHTFVGATHAIFSK